VTPGSAVSGSANHVFEEEDAHFNNNKSNSTQAAAGGDGSSGGIQDNGVSVFVGDFDITLPPGKDPRKGFASGDSALAGTIPVTVEVSPRTVSPTVDVPLGVKPNEGVKSRGKDATTPPTMSPQQPPAVSPSRAEADADPRRCCTLQ